ncbi:3'(2'), 5'-bisphosphate nucleotidase [Bosea sp. CRIB-10]|uniref:3'(2'),5'-bisphosphate nucleotidase CysQ family protein n=1 Tax=Bosea sp. CRIB-10 TaxID=378404 RepID=UPI0008E4DE9E|nr:3'(2'),5'-bisphosphate nucleotidase CysQ [Bosea sp. CRIB-10]SFC15658.1 3'(2'), 5'-bisphosphate nucleotidase [Bosea sp. CRIB-10]
MAIAHDDSRLTDQDGLARALGEAARRTAAVLLAKRAARDVKLKADGSPVCSADLAADFAAKQALAELLPGFPVISEESVGEIAPAEVFILLDPLDGTREFLASGDSYCVAIAVIRNGRPLAGAIAAPALGRLWFGGARCFAQALDDEAKPLGAPRQVHVRCEPEDGPLMLVSRFHGDTVSAGVAAAIAKGDGAPVSSAVKFGLIASGEADLHVRGGPTMEWDIAAGDVILAAAGGVVLTLDGEKPAYGNAERDFRNPPFVAASCERLARLAIEKAVACRPETCRA